MKETYIFGDIHGELKKLERVLVQIPEKKEARFIFLGDYIDRGPDSYGVIEALLQLSNEAECIFLIGNHDFGYFDLVRDNVWPNWLSHDGLWHQGAKETTESYQKAGVFPSVHRDSFFKQCKPYFIDEENNFYVHGGYDPSVDIKRQSPIYLYWDREFIRKAIHRPDFEDVNNFNKVFIGHTPVQYFVSDLTTPLKTGKTFLMDTGAGKFSTGPVSCIHLQTEELFQG